MSDVGSFQNYFLKPHVKRFFVTLWLIITKIHSRKNGSIIYCFALSAISHEKKIAKLMVVTVRNRFFSCGSLVDNLYTFLFIQFFVSHLFWVKVLVDLTEIFRNALC